MYRDNEHFDTVFFPPRTLDESVMLLLLLLLLFMKHDLINIKPTDTVVVVMAVVVVVVLVVGGGRSSRRRCRICIICVYNRYTFKYMRIRNVISRRIIRGGNIIIEELTETRICKNHTEWLKIIIFLIVILIILTIVRTLKSGC